MEQLMYRPGSRRDPAHWRVWGLTSACIPLGPRPTTALHQRSTTSSATVRVRRIVAATTRKGDRTVRPTSRLLLLNTLAARKLVANRGSDHQLQRGQRLLERPRRAWQEMGE
jgi:hypothetical protein